MVAVNQEWSLLEKITFRVSFTYFSLFIIFQNNGAYPLFYQISEKFNTFLYTFIPWVGENVLNITYNIKVGPNGNCR